MSSQLRGRVAVITGASSGIGRATALEFARRGAAVALTARRAEALEEVAAECRALGAQALAIPADVTDEAAVQAVADTAVRELGGLDVWFNNAGVSLLGRFDETPHDAWRRVLEVNLMGYVHGAWAAIPHFRRQGSGVLINNASIYARGGGRYLTAYVTSKFGIRGFGEALRQELHGTGIDVCTLLPASIDTPIFQHAGNFTGRATKALTPTNPPEKVARTVARLARRPRREVVVGLGSRSLVTLHDLAPAVFERVAAQQAEHDHLARTPAGPTLGNLFTPDPEGTGIHGGWRNETARRGVALAGLALVPVALAAARRARGGGDAAPEGSAAANGDGAAGAVTPEQAALPAADGSPDR